MECNLVPCSAMELGVPMKMDRIYTRILFLLCLFMACSAIASEISPFYFSRISATDDEGQYNEWQRLIKYKLWGTGVNDEGIVFNNQDIHISDSVGYSGSATGSFIIRNDKHSIGGPLAFGGWFSNNTGEDSILTGPSHFGKDISIETNAYNNNNVAWFGSVCSDKNSYKSFDKALARGKGTIDCSPSAVPEIDSTLDVPQVDWDYDGFSLVHEGDWIFSKSTGLARNAAVSVIDIPMGTDYYDILVTGNLDVQDGCDTLYINNPGNRNVRIFIKGALKIASAMHNIVILNDMGETVSNRDYAGNLVIYSQGDIQFPAQECIYQGTYISGGFISFMQHYSFAGQILAKKVSIDAHFKAGDFRYVPFNPPVINLAPSSMAYEDHWETGDTVMLELSKDPPTQVTFDYCFELKTADKCDGLKDDPDCFDANYNDVLNNKYNTSTRHAEGIVDIPLCGESTARGVFEQGSRTLKNPIVLYAVDDPYEEEDENVSIKVFNLSAAIVPTGNRNPDASYTMFYTIVDNDKRPTSKDTVVVAKVNETLNVDKFPAYAADGVTPLLNYYVSIRDIPEKGTLTYNGKAVAVGDSIPADPTTGKISGLIFEPVKDAYGTPYAEIGFDLCKPKTDGLCATGNTMSINVVSVQYFVKENAPVDTVVGVLEDMRVSGPLTCSIVSGDAGTTFSFGTETSLVLKSELDFETKPSYGFFVKCSNGTAYDSTIVSVTVIDVNEPPAIHDTTFHVKENQPAGSVVDTLPVLDEDKNIEFLKNKLTIIGGDVDKYAIGESSGVITTKVALDYEADKFDTVIVLVEDPDGNKDTATVIIAVDNIVEIPKITVTRAETPDTVWNYPSDTLYINRTEITLSWEADNIPQPDTTVKDLHEGYNTVVLTYYDKTQDRGTQATIVIFVCTRTPDIKVSADVKPVVADNIYTIVEQVPASDTSYYVNKVDNTILVDIKTPILDATYTDSTCNYKTENISISAKLDTLKIEAAPYKKMEEIVKANLIADIIPPEGATIANANDSLMLVTYQTKAGGETVTVSYYTDSKGDIVKDASGTEVMTVSFETTDAVGKTITMSYQADAMTGNLIEQWNGGSYIVTYPYTDKAGKKVDISYFVNTSGKVMKNEEGNTGFEVAYDYTDSTFGNTCHRSIFVVLDTIKPVVEILTPEDGSKVSANFVTVVWTVNDEKQDSLNTQGLVKGTNPIIRIYRDKAGNEASATSIVVLKNPKDISISVEKSVTLMDEDRLEKYYSVGEPPKKNQNFAVSIYNNAKDAEDEVLIGGNMKTQEGSGKAPYPGLEDHLGPTLTIDVKVPVANAVGGLATFDDILASDGLVSLDGVDAQGGKKMAPQQYVDEYCLDEFKDTFKGDYSKINLYDSKLSVHVWIFTNLGAYVDDYSFTVDMNDPDYANKAGMLSMYFELKPDRDGNVRTKDGKLMATGAYVYKTEVTMRTKLQCTMPPISDDMPKANLKGATRKVSDDMLRPFGYKRPKIK